MLPSQLIFVMASEPEINQVDLIRVCQASEDILRLDITVDEVDTVKDP